MDVARDDSSEFERVARSREWALISARLYYHASADAIDPATVVVREGRISQVLAGGPPSGGVPSIDVGGATVVPGFWNSHVHFTEPHWAGAREAPAEGLTAHLRRFVGQYGFTTVVDTGSDPRTTLALRARIQAGEVIGPQVLTAGTGLYPPKGLPYYIRGSIPWYAPWFIPQPGHGAAAVRAVRKNLARGCDLVKLFTGSYVARGRVKPMPLPVATAAVAEAHRQGRPVFAHPSNLEGTRVALESGVDVLAHAPDSPEGVDRTLLARLVAQRTAMIPTLKMFGSTVTQDRSYLDPIYEVVRSFGALGGELLFGTDAGYMTDYSTREEFTALAECGLDWRTVLRMLTSAPAARFGQSDRASISAGGPADLVVLRDDPARDLRAFGAVRATVRNGRVLWAAP